jgi:hypothetical protein
MSVKIYNFHRNNKAASGSVRINSKLSSSLATTAAAALAVWTAGLIFTTTSCPGTGLISSRYHIFRKR